MGGGVLGGGIESIGAQMDLFDFGGNSLAEARPPSSVSGPDRVVAASPPPLPAGAEVVYVRNLRAKNYRLTLRRDGVPVATIPARGSEKQARAFVKKNGEWLERMRERHRRQPRLPSRWTVGTEIMWRGERAAIRALERGGRPRVGILDDVFRVSDLAGDMRPTLESAFQSRARIELSARTWELAAETGMAVKKVAIRNQRTRWGSCTEGGVISLNWRLILSPPEVSDYVIYHELMHLREMNHSRRFWAAVAEVCPAWESAEAWLDEHGTFLGL
ncbi:MAG: SprT family zinc-dependent metalloprotease [Synoicihabitans sp.]